MRSRVEILALLAFFFFGFGCANADGGRSSDDDRIDLEWLNHRASEFTQFGYNPFKREIAGPELMALTSEGVVKRIGEPLTRETTEVPDQSGSDFDTKVTFQYDGFLIGVIDYGLGIPCSAINYLEVVGNTEPLKYGLEIGRSTRSDIASIFSPAGLSLSTHGLVISVPAIERDDQFVPPVTYIVVSFEFDEFEILKKVRIE